MGFLKRNKISRSVGRLRKVGSVRRHLVCPFDEGRMSTFLFHIPFDIFRSHSRVGQLLREVPKAKLGLPAVRITVELIKQSDDERFGILSAVKSVCFTVVYPFTLEIEEVSSVVPWFLTVPIFGYVFGYIFLGETLSSQQLLGSVIILSGVFLISVDFSGQKRKLRWRPIIYMMIACILIAISGVIFKYVTIGNNFWVSSFWGYAGLGIFGILIFLFVPKYRNEFISMNRQGGKKIFALNTMSEILTIIGNLLTNFALLLAPITMVYLVGSFQPAIVLFLTLCATKFFPNIVKENLRKDVLLPKVIAIIVMIIGSAILFI